MLDARRPPDLLTVAERLSFLQLDPIAVVAPSADLVLWSRLGNDYQPTDLVDALERDRALFEWRGQDRHNEPNFVMVRPSSQFDVVLGQMLALRDKPGEVKDWLAANDGFRRRVLDQLRSDGPLPSRAIADTAEVPWQSSGWTHERNVNQMLEFLWSRAYVAVAGRDGKQRLWDLAERVYPPNVTPVPVDEAVRLRDERRLRSLGVARSRVVGEAGLPVTVEGTKGVWRLDPDADPDDFEGRTGLLSPFDRLVHDRRRALELFDFDYTLELYKPAAQRRWGFYVLPILSGDRLIGKADLTADRETSALRVLALHQDIDFTNPVRSAVDDQLAELATWLGLATVRFG
jgi:uncharacterized protein YcaQ